LRAAGVDATTPDPAGGVVLRNGAGAPTGVLLEGAVPLLDRAVPQPDDDAVARALDSYGRTLISTGIVECHDPGEPWGEPLRFVRLLARLGVQERLPVRAVVSIRDHELDAALEAALHSGDELAATNTAAVRFGWLKLFADGTLGSRTAAMLEPYVAAEHDGPAGESGTLLTDPSELRALATRAATGGIATQIHAIGDRAVRVAVDALERLPALPLTPRVEHAQAVAADEIERMAAAGITASVQPIHLRADAPKARRVWADRLGRAYPFRAMRERGVRLAFGSDAPIEPADPWTGLSLAVTRRHIAWDAQGPFVREQALDVPTALRAACIGPAESAGEGNRGRLVRGSSADLVVVAADALRADGSGLAGAAPVLTFVAGREAWRDEAWDREPGRS
jgi:predicted amidohydrolase YtcJ